MLRQCARPTCSAPAATTLSYDYSGRVVWLDPLHDDAHPARHDLCGNHARRLSVPNGWRLENRLLEHSVADGKVVEQDARLVESQGS